MLSCLVVKRQLLRAVWQLLRICTSVYLSGHSLHTGDGCLAHRWR